MIVAKGTIEHSTIDHFREWIRVTSRGARFFVRRTTSDSVEVVSSTPHAALHYVVDGKGPASTASRLHSIVLRLTSNKADLRWQVTWEGWAKLLAPSVGVLFLLAMICEAFKGGLSHQSFGTWLLAISVELVFGVLPGVFVFRWIRDCRREVRGLVQLVEDFRRRSE